MLLSEELISISRLKYELDGTVYPFPKDFQMRAGNTKTRAYEAIGAVKWKCLDAA